MLLSRKRARDVESPLLRGPEVLLATMGGRHHSFEGKRLLRDLVDARSGQRDALLDLLARLQDRDAPTPSVAPVTTTVDQSPEMSRAHVSSQELFLSVVLEWQRSPEGARLAEHVDVEVESPTAAVFRHDRSFRSTRESRYASSSSSASSSASSYASSSEDERDDRTDFSTRKRSRFDEDVSPTSVHHMPVIMAPTPLRLDSPMKRIGVYSPRARQELLAKYMAKRARRLSQNKVRYGVRKTLANARPRVKGRFVKTEQPLTAALVQSQAPAAN